jgi:hypothetical protein
VVCCLAVAAPSQTRSCAGSEVREVAFRLATFPVQKIAGAVLFHAGLYVDADGAPNAYGPNNKGLDFTANAKNGGRFTSVVLGPDGQPMLQRSGRFKGFYISTTSLRNAAGSAQATETYLNAAKVPYFVLPPEFIDQFGVTLGDLALVTNTANGRSAFAIFADVGPRGKIGEGSIDLAHALGLDSNPRNGGTSKPNIAYLVFPGSGLGPGKLRTAKQVSASGARVFHKWGGDRRLRACSAIN